MSTLQNKRMHAPDYFFISVFSILVIAGLFILYSASMSLGISTFNEPAYYLLHQLLYGVLPGIVGFLIFFRWVPYRSLKKIALPVLVVALTLALLVFVPHIGLKLQGAARWIRIGSLFSFQPSEILKLALILYFAAWIDGRGVEERKNFWQSTLLFLILLGIGGGVLFLQNDMGTAIVTTVTLFAMYLLSGAPWKHVGAVFLLLLCFGGLFIASDSYRINRIKTYFTHSNSTQSNQTTDYQIHQALIAIGSGGVFGVGFGQSRQKFSYLPEPMGDSIFAVVGEELGFVGVVGILTLLLLFLWSGIRIAQRAPDFFGRFLVLGVLFLIAAQFMLNVAAISGLVPLTGVPLPFISYGGTFLAILMTACGIVAQISRYGSSA